MKWKRDNLKLSPTIKRVCASYRKESDLLGEFLGEVCNTDVNQKVEQVDLYKQYRAWSNVNGVKSVAKASFTRRLAERGHPEKRSNGKRYYDGLQIVNHVHVPMGLL